MNIKDWDLEYRKEQTERTRKLWKEGYYNFKIAPLLERKCVNPTCCILFRSKSYESKKFCSSRCAARVNNTRRIRLPSSKCIDCDGITKRRGYKYCSNKCQIEYQYKVQVMKWKSGLTNDNIGISTRVVAKFIRRYLLEKYNNKCSLCFWDKVHPVTGHVPLEVDHIDGNSENNVESNLRILCPNCHSLTHSFRNLNKGKGRGWRLTYIADHKAV